ncbi:MAG: RidA family protein [Planctomycetaceae bacterium]|nr:RidA family protein [Planctomycetaceae bacterium]
MIEAIEVPEVAALKLPLSHAIKAGGFVFVSGQASVNEAGEIVSDTIEGEIRRSFDNIKRILAASGQTMKDVIQVRSYVGDPKDLAVYNEIYREYFSSPYPARTTLTGCIPDFIKFEVDVTAVCS